MPNVTPRVPIQTPMFDADGNMTRTWVIFLERIGSWTSIINSGGDTRCAQKATFGLLRPLAVSDDLTNHYIARGAGYLRNWTINAKTPPTGQAAILDIERSVDEGGTWFSIFESAQRPQIPAGDDTRIDGTAFKEDNPGTEVKEDRIEEGDLLRINCDQAGSLEPGQDIEVVLQWWEDPPA